jgi:tetratricopeptide (TPR) repeat protein
MLLVLPQGLAATPPPADLLSAGRVDEAVGALRARVQANPNDADAYFWLERAYFALQRWDDAISTGQKAIDLAPNNSEYHLWLGRTYGEKADHSSWTTALALAKKTRAEFERAVELNGNSVDARQDLAEFYVEAPSFLGGGKEKAAAQAVEVQRLNSAAGAHWIKARIAEKDKNYALAEQEYKAAVQASGGNPDKLLNLASFYRRRGRGSDVEATVNQAVQAATRMQHPHVLYDAAELLYRAGRNFSGAADLLRNYIASAQHTEDAPVFRAHYLLGTILEKLGDRRAAADQYRAALSLARGFEPAQSALSKIQ